MYLHVHVCVPTGYCVTNLLLFFKYNTDIHVIGFCLPIFLVCLHMYMFFVCVYTVCLFVGLFVCVRVGENGERHGGEDHSVRKGESPETKTG